ncbi:GSCOCG00000943001-RA-CDS [Cotesia congregata]|uniref:Ribosome assembly factor mrt4 n=1 Tax=Cotesia congregata TaxID=51543 RepID=A0A8J2MMB8_COTCN|nr:GSCOCG00000943001-RA-CDS [Cotesia congregata]CAG5095810.1 Similar to Mrto4: mRNA turnover protein 4 homolog (Mus musculus) [Cotesia congregata]
MPKSKRDKKISLTKTSKKGKALKDHIIDDVRNCVEKYDRICVFAVRNMRNNKLKNLREEWVDSRFFFGKNKIIAIGMGKTPAEEIADGIHKLANNLHGQCGLLFTNKSKRQVLDWMDKYSEVEYARAGFIVPETIVLPEGPLPDFSHAIEPHLRQLGMPTALKKGVVTLIKDYEVCKKGFPLTPEQAKILKLFSMQLATFKLIPLGFYSKKKGYQKIKAADDNENIENMETEIVDET